MSKQSSVEWLVSELMKYDTTRAVNGENYFIVIPAQKVDEIKEVASKMYQEEIKEALTVGFDVGCKHSNNIETAFE